MRRKIFIERALAPLATTVALELRPSWERRSHAPEANYYGHFPEKDSIRGSGSLKAHGAAHRLFVGATVDAEMLCCDDAFILALADQCSMVAPSAAMTWKTLRPSPDSYSFRLADELMAFAWRHKMKVRGRHLAGHDDLPAWFATAVTKENARSSLVDHIMTVGRRYKGRIHSWDVVNEAVQPQDGMADGLRLSPWMKLLGRDYIDAAFRTARKADPDALLTYNEYGLEYDNDEHDGRRAATLQLLRRLVNNRVPIDALGIQSHLKANACHTIGRGLSDFMARVRGLGLQIYITELCVDATNVPFADLAERERIIADTCREYLSVALQDPAVKAVITSSLRSQATTEANSSGPSQRGCSLLFDREYRPQKAFFVMRDCIDDRVTLPIPPGDYLISAKRNYVDRIVASS